MKAIALVLLLTLPLGGCATLTVATIGGLVAAGAITGAGRAVGEAATRNIIRKWKRCHHIRDYNARHVCYERVKYEARALH